MFRNIKIIFSSQFSVIIENIKELIKASSSFLNYLSDSDVQISTRYTVFILLCILFLQLHYEISNIFLFSFFIIVIIFNLQHRNYKSFSLFSVYLFFVFICFFFLLIISSSIEEFYQIKGFFCREIISQETQKHLKKLCFKELCSV